MTIRFSFTVISEELTYFQWPVKLAFIRDVVEPGIEM